MSTEIYRFVFILFKFCGKVFGEKSKYSCTASNINRVYMDDHNNASPVQRSKGGYDTGQWPNESVICLV